MQQEADVLRSYVATREQYQQQLKEVNEATTELLAQRDRLKKRFELALFEDSHEQQENIRGQRSRLDKQLDELEAEARTLRAQVREHQLSPDAVAELIVRASLVQTPDVKKLMQAIEAEAKNLVSEISKDVTAGLRKHTTDAALHRSQMELNARYASQHRREQRYWERREQGQTDYLRSIGFVDADVSDTDALHAARGTPRKLVPGDVEVEDTGDIDLVLER